VKKIKQITKDTLNASIIMCFPIIMLLIAAVLSFNPEVKTSDLTVMFFSAAITLMICFGLCFADLNPLGFNA
jgi:hypothetical protein